MKIAIVVNSCYKYHSHTIPKILKNIKSQYDDVFIVVGESEIEYDCMYCGVKTFFRTWANMDNNGLIWVVKTDKLSGYDWIFYIHDTCVPLENFFESVYEIFEKYNCSNYDATKIHDISMSIGYYRVSKLLSDDISSYINSTINYDKNSEVIKEIKSKVEDDIFNHIENKFTIPNIRRVVTEECENVYGSQTKRIIEHWSEPSFLKMKANYEGTYEIIDL